MFTQSIWLNCPHISCKNRHQPNLWWEFISSLLHIKDERTREISRLTSKLNDSALNRDSPVPYCNPEGVGGHQASSATWWRTYSTKESARGDQKRANSPPKTAKDTNCFSPKCTLSHRKTNFIYKKKRFCGSDKFSFGEYVGDVTSREATGAFSCHGN